MEDKSPLHVLWVGFVLLLAALFSPTKPPVIEPGPPDEPTPVVQPVEPVLELTAIGKLALSAGATYLDGLAKAYTLGADGLRAGQGGAEVQSAMNAAMKSNRDTAFKPLAERMSVDSAGDAAKQAACLTEASAGYTEAANRIRKEPQP